MTDVRRSVVLRRYMATGKHIGKVVLRVREEEAAGARPASKLVSAMPRTYMHPCKSYVLVGQYCFPSSLYFNTL